jgi:hypothetical protein
MTDKEYNKLEKHYNKLVKKGTIKTINDAHIYQLAIEKAIKVIRCCTEFADGKCRPMVNADWTYLRCECGKRFEPKG